MDVLHREVSNPTETTHIREQMLVLEFGRGLPCSNPCRTARPGQVAPSLPEGWGAVITASNRQPAPAQEGGVQLVAMRTQWGKVQKQQEVL